MATSGSKQPKAAAKAHPAPEPDADETPAPRPKKGGRLKILILAVMLLAAGGGGAWYFLHGDPVGEEDKPVAKKGNAKADAAKHASSKPPVFIPLEQFTVNLQSEEASPQFLQVTLVVKATDSVVADEIKLHMPEVRNRVLMLLSAKTASEITSIDGKKTLSAELAREITQPIADGIPTQSIDSVLFTSFVVQ